MKERWFNYRPLCLIFGFLLLGSVFAFYIFQNLILTIIVTLVILGALIALAIYKKKPQYILVPLIAFILGIGAYSLAILSFNNTINFTPTTIQARVYDVNKEDDGVLSVEADSCKFDGKSDSSNILIFIYDKGSVFENIHIGSIIEFEPNKFYKSELFFYDTPNARMYANNVKYTASVYMENITYLKTDMTFDEIVRDHIKQDLSSVLTNENAEIAYSALFGDKDLLSNKQYDAYKLSGVAHLLAVSGLHVSIIVNIVKKLFKFNKSRKWWKFFIILILLMFYMYLCDFSVSILRASIMSLILLISAILGKEYDSFNSISIAGIAVFLINPLCVFDVAFLLSFSCVLGITMLNKPIHKMLEKTKMPSKIVDSVSISLSVTIAIVMIMAYYFQTLNIISIIANVILIPIFTMGFTVLFIISMLGLIIPYIQYLLFPLNYLFDFINIIAATFGNL